jgi:hypothetical protein
MKNSPLLMVAVLAAVPMLSTAVVVPVQQVSAQGTDFNFEQDQDNRCGGSAECRNTATINFGLGDSGGDFPEGYMKISIFIHHKRTG